MVGPHRVAGAHAGAGARRGGGGRSLGAALARAVAFLRRGRADFLCRASDKTEPPAAMGAHAVGDHHRPRAGGAAALRPGVGRRAARQRARHPGGVDRRHAARARSRRCCRCPRCSILRAWLVEWLLQFLEWCAALPGALWQQHVPPLWSVLARARRRGLAARAARRALAHGRARADGAGVRRSRRRAPAAGDGVDHHARRRAGPRRAGAHRDPHAALRRRAGLRRRKPTAAGAWSCRCCARRASRASTRWC